MRPSFVEATGSALQDSVDADGLFDWHEGLFLRSRWPKRFSGSGRFGGVSVLTEDVAMREKVGASNLSVKAIPSNRCFGHICVSSQSVRSEGGNACQSHGFEITSFLCRKHEAASRLPSYPVRNRSRRCICQWNATALLPMLRVRLHRRARCGRIPNTVISLTSGITVAERIERKDGSKSHGGQPHQLKILRRYHLAQGPEVLGTVILTEGSVDAQRHQKWKQRI